MNTLNNNLGYERLEASFPNEAHASAIPPVGYMIEAGITGNFTDLAFSHVPNWK